MAKSRVAIEDEMRRHLRELWLLVQDWYEVQGVGIDYQESEHDIQHYGSAMFGRATEDNPDFWRGGLFNNACLTLRNPSPGKEPGDGYIDIGLRSDELCMALERHNKKNGKNTEVNGYDGFNDGGNRCPHD